MGRRGARSARLDPGTAHAIVADGARRRRGRPGPRSRRRAAGRWWRRSATRTATRPPGRCWSGWPRSDPTWSSSRWAGPAVRRGRARATIATRGASRASGEAAAELLARARADGAAVSAADLVIAGGTVLRDGAAEAGDVAIAGGRVAARAPRRAARCSTPRACWWRPASSTCRSTAPSASTSRTSRSAGPRSPCSCRAPASRPGARRSSPVPLESIARAQASVVGAAPDGAAAPLGLHLEGPMLSPAHRGAHPLEHQRLPRSRAVRRLVAGHRRRAGHARPRAAGRHRRRSRRSSGAASPSRSATPRPGRPRSRRRRTPARAA